MRFLTSLLALAPLIGIWAQQAPPYPIHFPKNQSVTHATRKLSGVSLSTTRGTQTQTRDPQKAYSYLPTATPLTVYPGEKLRFNVLFNTGWMHTYVYLDLNQNGQFEVSEESPSELISYSYYQGKNSAGKSVQGDVGTVPPNYTIPQNLPYGIYRLRFKVDWNSIDPAGALSPADNSPSGDNGILKNGGAIADVLLNVQSPQSGLCVKSETGRIVQANGKELPSTISSNEDLALRIIAPEGKVVSQLVVQSGYHFDQAPWLYENRQWQEKELPSFLLQNGMLHLPAEMLWGEVALKAEFIDAPKQVSQSDYPLNFPHSLQHLSEVPGGLQSLKVVATEGGTSTINLSKDQATKIYQDLSQQYEQQVSLVPGDQISTQINHIGKSPLHAYLYIDLNQDGQFTPILQANGIPTSASELVAYSYYDGYNSLGQPSDSQMPSNSLPNFTIPSLLPLGVYRARLVLDYNSIDPAGRYYENNSPQSIHRTGGQIVDFLLNVHKQKSSISLHTKHGNIYGRNGSLPESVPAYQALPIRLLPVAAGYLRDSFSIRHGHNLNGPQYIRGNRQWEEFSPKLAQSATLFTLPAHLIDGNVEITATYSPGSQAQYFPVFVEEFNGENGSQPNSSIWRSSTRYPGVTWARFISNAPEVAFIEKGNLVCRALPTPAHEKEKGEQQPMISGAIETRGAFDFQYGKVEGRIRTHKHAGNFPAFWMMPTPVPNQKGWPHEGEIDIWEQIDSKDTGFHTIHTNWTYNLKNKNNPPSSFNSANVDMDSYHTYGLEWTPTYIKWFVDGREVGTYRKSLLQNQLNQGQWPFDRKFYLILNQSVGNGSWAQAADEKHTYETRFDWVRVYQTKEQNPLASLEVPTAHPPLSTPCYYDLSGRRVLQPTSGIYILNGKKVVVP